MVAPLPRRLRVLVSVRDVAEARLAAAAGVDFIDLKEPRHGALGGLPPAEIARIVAALRTAPRPPTAISATIGDLALDDVGHLLDVARRVADAGVDYVKVGVGRVPEAASVLRALAGSGMAVIPVFIADRGLDPVAVAVAVELAGGPGFPGLMVDTADKRAGSVVDLLDRAALGRFVGAVQATGAMAGVAGALRLADLPAVAAIAPDFAGFRSAVCVGDRAAALDEGLLARLVHCAADATPAAGGDASMGEHGGAVLSPIV